MLRGVARAGVCLIVVIGTGVPAWAQGSPARGWFGADYVYAIPTQGERTSVGLQASAVYPEPGNSNTFAIEGGFRINQRVGVAVRYEPARSSDPAALSVERFNASGLPISATAVTSSSLERTDHAVDFAVTVSAWKTEHIEVQVFGGPTLLRVSQQMVSSVTTEQVPPPPLAPSVVSITGAEVEQVSATGFGWNVGGDAAFYFMPHVAIVGGVRVRGGSVTVDDPLSNGESDLDPGRTSVNIGARYRF
jgi:hypothetical protein